MQFDLIIRGGTVVNGAGKTRADVGIVGSEITEIGDLSGNGAREILNAVDCLVLPGLIDSQVHFREPGMEHKEDLATGTFAAIHGGVTTIFEMPNTKPPTVSRAALNDKLARAKDRTYCDHAFFVGACKENIDELSDLEMLPGTPGIKMFVGSSTGSLLVDDLKFIEEVLRNGVRPCAIHSEKESILRENLAEYLRNTPEEFRSAKDHPHVRDKQAAIKSTQELIQLCIETKRPTHILHISTKEEIEMIAEAKRNGAPITAEVLPHHLWFAAPDCYDALGSLVQMNPPVRGKEHRAAIRDALRTRFFDVFGSDHAPHTMEEKSRPYPESPSGMPGVQTLLPVLFTLALRYPDLLDVCALVKLGCENPARLFGVQSKGFISPGFDADLAIVDPTVTIRFERSQIKSKCRWSPYEDEELFGIPRDVLLRGNVMIRDYTFVGSPIGKPVNYNWK